MGKTAMFTPVSAMISCADRTPIPVTSSSLGYRRGERGDQLLNLGVLAGDVAGQDIDAAQHRRAQAGMVVAEVPGQRLAQPGGSCGA